MQTRVTKKTHPIKEGWTHVSLELKDGYIPTAADEQRLLCCGMDPANYEVAVNDRMGRKLSGAIRRKDRRPALSEDFPVTAN